MFGWSDLLQILRKPAAFSFANLYIIVFRLSIIFAAVGLFISDMLLIFNMVWPWLFSETISSACSCLIAVTTWYSGFPVVLCHAFGCDIGQSVKLDLSFIRVYHHLNSVVGMDDQSRSWLLHYLVHTVLTRPNKVKTLDIWSVSGVSRNHKK